MVKDIPYSISLYTREARKNGSRALVEPAYSVLKTIRKTAATVPKLTKKCQDLYFITKDVKE
jgi:hypothetical protein